MLGDLVVGAGEEHAPLGVVGVARPHLVPGDDVGVAVEIGARAERREVGPCVGLAEALAPTVTAVHDARQEPTADVVVAVLEDALHEIAESRPRRRSRRGQLVVDDRVERRRQALAADLAWPREPEEPAVVERRGARPPGPASSRRRSTTPAGRGCWPSSQARSRRRNSASSGASAKSIGVPDPGARAPWSSTDRRRRARRSTATPGGGTRGRGTPRCCRCRRAPGSRSRTPMRAARAQYALATAPAASASAGSSASTAHAACRVTLDAPSVATSASASRCCTAWNEPTGTPY